MKKHSGILIMVLVCAASPTSTRRCAANWRDHGFDMYRIYGIGHTYGILWTEKQ